MEVLKMIKHVVTMDKDDFESLEVSIHQLKYNVNKLETSFTQGEILRYIHEIEDILGIEPPPIPEAVTAKWNVWHNAMYHSTTLSCTNCGYRHDMAIDTSDSPSGMPSVCPQCKAVMSGVE
jgi:hypothetical protein